MALVDFDKLAKEYANVGDDFGLSFVSEQNSQSKDSQPVSLDIDFQSIESILDKALQTK